VTALMAMRGIDFISATAFLAEIGDLSRFPTPRELMGYLGLAMHSERFTRSRLRAHKRAPRAPRYCLSARAFSAAHPTNRAAELTARGPNRMSGVISLTVLQPQ